MPDLDRPTPSRAASSLPCQRWHIAPAQPEAAQALADAIQLHPLLAQVLLNRGIDLPEAAQEFLQPESQVLPLPSEAFPDLSIAVDLLTTAIAQGEKIAICGDYDADGMTSTALLLRALRTMGAQVDYAIPSRMTDGYGINSRIVEEFHQEGVQVVLTVDNGIAAREAIAHARDLGLTVIITDHHDLPPELPPAHAILNPKLIEETSPYRGLAGVGMAYVLAVSLAQRLEQTRNLTTPLIELFTLGTIADLAPLTGVNRRWVRRGLKLLPQSKIPGIQALIQVAGLGGADKALKPEAIGFRLGPRINAVGRIANPQIVIELLTTDDMGRSLELAMSCEQINQKRQQLCELIEQDAIAWCQDNQPDLLRDRVLVVVQPEWHHGVIGIVASRLVERYGVPVFIGTYEDDAQTQIRGSARGIPEFHVFEALQFCGTLLHKYGGHRAAGGFSLPAEHLDDFQCQLSLFANQQLLPDHLKPLVHIDAQANLCDLTLELYEQIDYLHPCGIDNPDPVFWTPHVRVVEQTTIGRGQAHLKLTVAQQDPASPELKAIAWRWGEYLPLPKGVDIAYRLRLNEWNGQKTVELELVGIRASGGEAGGQDRETDRWHSLADAIAPPQTMAHPNPVPTVASPTHPGDRSPEDLEATSIALSATTLDAAQHHTLPSNLEFFYSQRKYTCSIVLTSKDQNPELHIRNPEGQVLAVQPQHRRGILGRTAEDAQAVDVFQPHYFNLIRAAINALELAGKDQQLRQIEQRLAATEREVQRLQQQVHDLTQALATSAAIAPSVRLTTPPNDPTLAEMDTKAVPAIAPTKPIIQSDLLKRDSWLIHLTSNPAISVRGELRTHLGQDHWSGLQTRSQTDLCQIYEQYRQAIALASDETFRPNYAEIGQLWIATLEREIAQVFFKYLRQTWYEQGDPLEIAGISLKTRKKYKLDMIPPLLAEFWQVLSPQRLDNPELHSTVDMTQMVSTQVSASDRQRVASVLSQPNQIFYGWHEQPSEIASAIAQVHQWATWMTSSGNGLTHAQFEQLQRVGFRVLRSLYRGRRLEEL